MAAKDNLRNKETIALIEAYLLQEARDNFFSFRRLIHPKAYVGWFYKKISSILQRYYLDLVAGKTPQVLILAPPQHGKSSAVEDFTAWLMGKHKDLRTIYTAYSSDLLKKANKNIQRVLTSSAYLRVFGDVLVDSHTRSTGGKVRNLSHLDHKDGLGYIKFTATGGAITGTTLDFGVIDDPIKGRGAANSPTIRENIWDWWKNDFMTRFDEKASFLMILTHWHVDDLAGRIMALDKSISVHKFPAIAMEDEEFRKAGEPLFPEFKSLEFLQKQRLRLGEGDWASLYQQSPIIQGGNLFKKDWLIPIKREVINALSFDRIFITADTAQKIKELNDYTVYGAFGVKDGNLYLLDMYRAKVTSLEREEAARRFYAKWNIFPFQGFFIEMKASGIDLFQRLREGDQRLGYKPLMVKGIERDTDKVSRANNIITYLELNKFFIANDIKCLDDIYAELLAFPEGPHDDIVDVIIDGVYVAYHETVVDFKRVNDILIKETLSIAPAKSEIFQRWKNEI